MNATHHPRRVRLRRPLLFVPLVLLGATLLVRSHLPRPTTEGDKWLWEQAEKTHVLTLLVGFSRIDKADKALEVDPPEPRELDGKAELDVQDRQGIRVLLRAFHDTPAFTRTTLIDPPEEYAWEMPLYLRQDHYNEYMALYKWRGHYFLMNNRGKTMTNLASVERFLQVVRDAVKRAKQHQSGYLFKPLK